MGIINHDPYPLPYSGDTVTSTYIHTQVGDHINIRKISRTTYEANTYFHVHYDQQAYTDGRAELGGIPIHMSISKTDIESTNIYTLFYNRLKELYPNHTDLQPDETEDPEVPPEVPPEDPEVPPE